MRATAEEATVAVTADEILEEEGSAGEGLFSGGGLSIGGDGTC